MEIVLNKCYGGFGLSPLAIKAYLKRKGKDCYFYNQTKYKHSDKKNEFTLVKTSKSDTVRFNIFTKNLGETFSKWPKEKGVYFYDRDIERSDPDLIAVVKKLGEKANGWAAELRIVDIPDGIDYSISDYDGIETAEEPH